MIGIVEIHKCNEIPTCVVVRRLTNCHERFSNRSLPNVCQIIRYLRHMFSSPRDLVAMVVLTTRILMLLFKLGQVVSIV